MKIRKFIDFINEEFNDTPETYIESTLRQIKKKIDNMFEFQGEEKEEEVREPEKKPKFKSTKDAKEEGIGKEKSMTFKDLGVRLESSEISKYSKQYDNLTVKFSDDESTYNLYIMIELKEALPKEPDKDFSNDDIEKCYIKFKKYDLDTFEVIGQLTKNVKIKDINEEFLINLKIELDEKFGEEGEEFSIETE
jgi:hypothetical protein